ncbi:twin transmembrane helix small protein [Mangrovibrevibacter kandeliae]|uniref:twin transmembrane helix small protein n=1 Tax=Mangrovibrevibacter kandeliae TaxID=2968473 RepID=UPI00211802EC|nr:MULTISPECIES: twin transmembrane helix small protein [unclassified Aurantimonas]MCQ8783820.1 twin transmembrane helix small protein [Aurantimonas sp. CSK15Z-1]MCW4116542.1 twin transmembrane helix small protein [Aurantimonas sp. MSK8Z-1]
MSGFLTFLAVIFMGLVAVVLVMGLVNLMRGGPANRSQKLMQARVMLQAIAVLIIVGALWFAR